MAVDGSRVDAARTRPNEQKLKIAGRTKTHPQWWVTAISHLPTNLLWDWRQGPGTDDERNHLRQMLPSLPSSTLLVGDIGFCNFDLMWELHCHQIDFLIRGGGNTTLLAEVGRENVERVGEHRYVYFYPLRKRGLPPLRLRLIVLKRKGQRVYLLTSVSDSTRLSRSIASELYAARWGIEVSYRSLKQTLGRRKVLARTPQAGASELAGGMLGLALLMLQAALAQGANIVRVSVSKVLGVVQRALEALRNKRSSRRFVERLRETVRDAYVRRRSKRARNWPHKKKEALRSPPKRGTPQPTEFAQADKARKRLDRLILGPNMGRLRLTALGGTLGLRSVDSVLRLNVRPCRHRHKMCFGGAVSPPGHRANHAPTIPRHADHGGLRIAQDTLHCVLNRNSSRTPRLSVYGG
jgi:hypothetical protein